MKLLFSMAYVSLAVLGCHGPDAPKCREKITPVEAKRALLEMLARKDEGKLPNDVAAYLRSDAFVQSLEQSEIVAGDESKEFRIGGFGGVLCNKDTGVFSISLEWKGGHVFHLRGTFNQRDGGAWVARIVGYEHMNNGR